MRGVRGGVGRGFSARPLPVLAAGLVDVPVGASAHLASLVLEQVLHPLALGRQLRLELVVHVSPMGGEGRAGRGTRRLDQHPQLAEPPPGAAMSGARRGRRAKGTGRGAVCFCFGLGLFGGGEGARSAAATRFNWAPRGAAREVPGVVVRLREPAPPPQAGRRSSRTTTPGMPRVAPAGRRRRAALSGDTGAFQRPLGTC